MAEPNVWARSEGQRLSWANRHDRNRVPSPPRPITPATTSGAGYGRSALLGEVEQLQSLAGTEGTRNAQLNSAAFNLYQLVASQHLHEQEVHDALTAAALAIGLSQAETERTIASGRRAGLLQPRQVPDRSDAGQVTEVGVAEFGLEPEGEPGLDLHERLVHAELRTLRARSEARQRFAEEQQGPLEPFDAGTLAEVLARPPQPASRIDGLIPWQAGTLLTAQRKAGKTTTVLNLARSLLTGEDFLGRLGVRQVDGEVAILNYEVTGAQLSRWAEEVGVPRDRLFLVNLRGRRNPLGFEEDRQRLARLLRDRGVETVICDPFGQAYTGTNQNDAGEVSSFLGMLDRFARADVGALDLVLTAHAGWNGERTRGSTALEDWADSIVTLTRDDSEEGGGTRYLRAIGRDVDLDEDRLNFDPDTRALTLAGAGSRAAGRAGRRDEDLDRAVLSVIIAEPGVNGSGIGRALREAGVGFQKGAERQAAARLVSAAKVEIRGGARGANCYHPVTYPDVPRPTPAGDVVTYPDPSYIGGVRQQDTSSADVPRITQTDEVDQ